MTTADQTAGFLDTGLARLLALVLAVALGFLIWKNWATDIKALFSADQQTTPIVSSSEPAKPANAELEKCLQQRVGDVDGMKEDGILSDAQYAAFKSRAEGLCRAQNPGG